MNISKHCILQVEDEEADIFLLQHAFKMVDVRASVHTVTDGQMAVDYLSGTGKFADREKYPMPCLVLLDLKLPKIDGLEVLGWMRRQKHLKSMVVIAFSSSGHPGDIERAYDLGVNSFLQKPADMEHTLEIARLLKDWWLTYNCFPPIVEHHRTPKGIKG